MSQCPFCDGAGKLVPPSPPPTLRCPYCRCELPLTHLFADPVSAAAVMRLAAVSIPLGEKVTQYVMLFGPQQRPLTTTRQVKLLLELLPDIERRGITYKGREWQASLRTWSDALDRILSARDAGKIDLPITGHNYLYAIIAQIANAAEAKREATAEQERRTGPRPAGVHGAQSIGDLVGQAGAQPRPAAAPTVATPSLAARKMREDIERHQERRRRLLERTGEDGSQAGQEGQPDE